MYFYLDIINRQYEMIADNLNNVKILNAKRTADRVEISGQRPLAACNDTKHDISLTGDCCLKMTQEFLAFRSFTNRLMFNSLLLFSNEDHH